MARTVSGAQRRVRYFRERAEVAGLTRVRRALIITAPCVGVFFPEILFVDRFRIARRRGLDTVQRGMLDPAALNFADMRMVGVVCVEDPDAVGERVIIIDQDRVFFRRVEPEDPFPGMEPGVVRVAPVADRVDPDRNLFVDREGVGVKDIDCGRGEGGALFGEDDVRIDQRGLIFERGKARFDLAVEGLLPKRGALPRR